MNLHFCHVACRPTGSVDRQPSKDPNGSFLNSGLFLMLPIPISEFLVAKLYPNDLVSIMNDMYSLPINRGHWLFIFHKKFPLFQVFQKRRKFTCFHFQRSFICKSFSVGLQVFFTSFQLKFFSHFTSSAKNHLHSISCKREFVIFWSPSDLYFIVLRSLLCRG